jgi:type 1 fimbria pilin
VGGFFIVGGEVVYDATLSGNVSVQGTIYTLGRFTVNGGGSALNVNGGVWSGQQVTLTGNAKIAYHSEYMNAIDALNINTSVRINSWSDTQNPYPL